MALMSNEDIDELRKLLQKARQKPLSFGLCMGKKPEDTVICLSIMKSPDVMMRQAKKQGETSKLTQGTVTVDGKIVELHCETDPPKGLRNNFKKFLLKSEIQMKARILTPGGEEMEDDEDDEEGAELETNELGAQDENQSQDSGNDSTDETGPQAPQTSNDQGQEAGTGNESQPDGTQQDTDSQEDPLAVAWGQAAARLGPAVLSFAEGNDPKAATVGKAWAGAEGAAAKGQYKVALAVLAKIEPLVGAQGAAPEQTAPVDPLAARWEAAAAELAPLYTAAMARNPENRSKLQAAWAMATEKAEVKDFKASLTIADRLKPALEAVVNAAPANGAAEVPKDVVAFQKSRVLWARTRSTMRSELGKLQSAIDSVVAQAEGVDVDTAGLVDHLEVFDDALEDILDKITMTPDGKDREDLKKKAVEAIRSYQDALSSDFFADVDKNNGFASVAITSTAVNSLATISKVLSA